MRNKITSWAQVGLFLSPPEVAQLVRLSRGGVYQLFHSKTFPSFSVGKRLMVERETLKQWLDEQANTNASSI